ncbi:MAG: hypothetical protein CMJ83_16580 [Planctomycetes bacterium]|nr:hypothetical protein [Planctomycetota bacterium]
MRWRRVSVVVVAGILSAGLAGGVLVGLQASGLTVDWSWWSLLVAPWPGLGLAWLSGRVARRPLRVVGRGREAAWLRAALRKTPGCPWKEAGDPAGPEPRVPVAGLPGSVPHDLAAAASTPGGPIPLHREGPAEGMGAAVKRSFDLAFVIVGMPLFLPLTLILGMLVRLAGGGPAFYTQERITRGGRSFRIHKIRSMGVDAESRGQPVWPEENDPRITGLGRTLRRFWLDELPQFFDVLRGDLSVVGPRPERPFFVQEFTRSLPNYPLRHQVMAGITGLAQVSGYVGNTSLEHRLHLDLRYARRWSPLLDLKILVGTVLSALRQPPIKAQES